MYRNVSELHTWTDNNRPNTGDGDGTIEKKKKPREMVSVNFNFNNFQLQNGEIVFE